MTARKLLIALTVGALTNLAVAAAVMAQASAPAPLVADVQVQGNRSTSLAAVMSYVKTRTGQPYDEQTVKADEKRLLQTRRFESVVTQLSRTPEGVVVTFVVVERPLLASVSVEGNNGIKTSELLKEVPFGAGDPVDRFMIESGRQAIAAKYHEKGFHQAQVTVDQRALANQSVVYQVVEGPQVFVRSVRFSGNETYGFLTLRFKLETSVRFWPFVPGYYDPDKLDRDVATLKNFYMSEGFFDVEVGRTLEFSADQRKLTITFIIREGPRFRVNSLRFAGSTVFDDASLTGDLQLQRGAFVTALKLQRDVKKLQDKYGEIGFIEAHVDARREFLPPDAPVPDWAMGLDRGRLGLVNIVFTIAENDQYRVGRIDIRGNSVTQARVIRRELRIFPEQLYDTVAIEESRRRLLETRLFEGEDGVTITPVGREPGVRDALVQVKEGKTAEFLVGVGVSSDAGLLGNISFTQRNFDIAAWPASWDDVAKGRAFKGAGQTFRISAEPGTELMRFSIEWFEPYVYDQPYSLGFKAYLFNRGRETYDESRAGVQASVGHRFKNNWYLEISPKVEGVDISGVADDAPPEVLADKGSHLLVGPRLTLVRDNTDSRWLPSTGDRLRLSYEELVGSYTFGRAMAEYQAFKTTYLDALDRKHILGARVMAGQIVGDAPTFEEFYGGGINSIRGFKYRGISPRSQGRLVSSGNVIRRVGEGEQIGGDFMFFAGSEYTFPIVTDMIRGVLFLDSGTVGDSSGFGTYRVSAGFGVRWIVPLMGPVPMSFDFGFPIAKDSQDDTEIFSFSLGWQF